jgi:hypothetical protein
LPYFLWMNTINYSASSPSFIQFMFILDPTISTKKSSGEGAKK